MASAPAASATQDGIGTARMVYGSLSELRDRAVSVAARTRVRSCATTPPTRGPHHRGRHRRRLRQRIRAPRQRVRAGFGDGPGSVRSAAGLAVRRGMQTGGGERRVSARSATGVERFATMDGSAPARPSTFAAALARYRIATAGQIVGLDDETRHRSGPHGAAEDPRRRHVRARPRCGARAPRASGCGCRSASPPTGSRSTWISRKPAENGMGPHGLCIGATGSGKSEFLRTLVLSMVATHSPDR